MASVNLETIIGETGTNAANWTQSAVDCDGNAITPPAGYTLNPVAITVTDPTDVDITVPGAYYFTHNIPASGACPPDCALAEVLADIGANAGTDGTISICIT